MANCITIPVTEEIIANAIRSDSNHCMIADAIKSLMPHVNRVMVDLQTIRWSDPRTGKRVMYLTPGVAQQALLAFDHGLDLPAFEFKLPARPMQITDMSSQNQDGGRKQAPRNKVIKTASPTARGTITVIGGRPPAAAVLAGGPGFTPRRGWKGKTRQYGLRVTIREKKDGN